MALPLYVTIASDLRAMIQTQTKHSFKIPSERALSSYYHVSRSTIRKSLQLLIAQQVITPIHGSGHFVGNKKSNLDFKQVLFYHEPFAKICMINEFAQLCTTKSKISLLIKYNNLSFIQTYSFNQNLSLLSNTDFINHQSIIQFLSLHFQQDALLLDQTCEFHKPSATQIALLNYDPSKSCFLIKHSFSLSTLSIKVETIIPQGYIIHLLN